jgi:hypothetical protein
LRHIFCALKNLVSNPIPTLPNRELTIQLPGGTSGFTLSEILVSLTLFFTTTLFAFQIFRIDHKIFAEQEEVVDMQQNARVAHDQIMRDLRMAGAGVPQGGAGSDIGYLYSIIPGDGGAQSPDTVRILADFAKVRTQLSDAMPNESAELKVDDASDFEVGAIALIAGPVDEGGYAAEVFRITHLSTDGQNMMQHRQSPPWNEDQKLGQTYLAESTISMMTYRKYFIDSSDPGHPLLMISDNEEAPSVLAHNIENLQIVYDLSSGERDVPSPEDPGRIRKVTVAMVARTSTPDPLWNNGINSITGEADHFRRMTLTSDVQPRNLE